jgi:hypothetical protein
MQRAGFCAFVTSRTAAPLSLAALRARSRPLPYDLPPSTAFDRERSRRGAALSSDWGRGNLAAEWSAAESSTAARYALAGRHEIRQVPCALDRLVSSADHE